MTVVTVLPETLARLEPISTDDDAAFRLAFEEAATGMCIQDESGQITRVNKELCRMLGFGERELLGRDVRDLFCLSSEAGSTPSPQMTGAVEALPGERREATLRHRDGHVLWGRVAARELRDALGFSTGRVWLIQDITEEKRLEESEREQRVLAQALRDSAADIYSTLDRGELMGRILANITVLVPHSGAYVLLMNSKGDHAHVAGVCRGYAERGAEPPDAEAWFRVADIPWLQELCETARPLAVADTQEPGARQAIGNRRWVRSFAAVPMRIDSGVTGALVVESDRSGAFSPSDAERLQALADQGAIALRQCRLHDEVRKSAAELEQRVAERTRRLSTLYQVTSITNQFLSLETILERCLEKVVPVLGCSGGTVHLLEQPGEKLWLVAQWGLSRDAAERLRSLETREGWAERAPYSGLLQPLFGSAPDQLPLQAIDTNLCPRVFSVPLLVGGQVLGVLSMLGGMEVRFDAEDRALLTSVAAHLGMALESADLHRRAEQEAVRAERGRLANDLHDAVTQTLFSATLIAEVLPQLWEINAVEAKKNLEKLHHLNRGALAEMRTLLLELRPGAIVQSRLSTLLNHLAETLTCRSRTQAEVSVADEPTLPPEVHLAFYRLAQEALNNIGKHARADRAEVVLQGEGDGIKLSVRDDGIGFDPEQIPPGHMGITIMRERTEKVGATFSIVSEPGHGTTVTVTWRPRGRN